MDKPVIFHSGESLLEVKQSRNAYRLLLERDDMSIILQDIASLINHTNFTFERLEYLQDTVVGIINLDQNRIMKIFTFINLLLMPATLIASFYGMNVKLPFAEFSFTWIGIIGIMASIVAVVFIAFKKRRML